MGLVHSTEFFEYLFQSRILWIDGEVRKGKSALAFRIAYELVTKYHFRQIITNVDSVFTTFPDDVTLREGKYLDAVIILDEAGMFLDLGRDAKGFLAGLGKLNCILISPSTNEIAQRIRYLTCHRIMNLMRFGLNGYIFECKSTIAQDKRKTRFLWENPKEVWGLYNTLPAAFDDREIGNFVIECIKNLGQPDPEKQYSIKKIQASGIQFSNSEMDTGKSEFGSGIQEQSQAIAEFEEAQARFRANVEYLESISVLSNRSSKRRR